MAKASTNKDRRLARAVRTPSTDDEAPRDQELDPAGESLMDEEVEQLAEVAPRTPVEVSRRQDGEEIAIEEEAADV